MNETHDISWVEHHTHPSDRVTIIERWVPAEEGDYAPFLFRPVGRSEYIAMKLESRRVIDDGHC
jgi:hypothetical protein